MTGEVRAGVLPLATVAGTPVAEPDVPAGVPTPASVARVRSRYPSA